MIHTTPDVIERLHPASFGQRGLWVLQELDPANTAYNISAVLRLRGALRRDALESAFAEVIRRHEPLRTTFCSKDGFIWQVIHEVPEKVLLCRDIAEAPEDGKKGAINRIVDEIAHTPFDLTTGPLFRAQLLILSEHESLLAVTVHHIVADGWSIGVMGREIDALYKSYCDGGKSPLPELELRYSSYVRTKTEWLDGPDAARQMQFWKELLAGAPSPIVLQRSSLIPPLRVHTNYGSREHFSISAELSSDLRQLCRRHRVTLFTTLLAAFYVLLYRYTGQDDIVVATFSASRDSLGSEGLIGFFSNVLPLRIKISRNATFRDWLTMVRDAALDAFANDGIPFQMLVDQLHPNRVYGNTPFVSVMFALNNFPRHRWDLGMVDVTCESVEPRRVRFNLDICLTEVGNSLEGTIEYATGLYDAGTIRRLVEHYRNALASAARNPDQCIRDLELLGPFERQVILEEWNAHQSAPQHRRCVHALFEARVEEYPSQIAVIHLDHAISYAALNSSANTVAADLRRRGIGRGALVAVCVARSTEMLVAMLGVLKSGAAYVPMDPNHPTERLTLILRQSHAAALITSDALHGIVQNYAGDVVLLNRLDFGESAPNPHTTTEVEDAAYVMFTSGTTGTPKGVVVEHRNLASFFDAVTPLLDDEESSRTWLAVTTISFDISMLELLWTLCHGYTVILQSGDLGTQVASANEQSIASQLLRRGVSHFQCTPSLARILSDTSEGLTALRQLRKFMIGGEVLPSVLGNKLRRELPGTLLNMYGPTEATIWSLAHAFGEVPDTVPIGRPIANTRLYILDETLEPVPIGVIGEIYLGGDGVARGYLSLSGITAERFLPDPFAPSPGARMYKTGDFGRYREDGTTDFVGRRDNQIKIRGYRIELDEIEAVLRQNPQVHDAVVSLRNEETVEPSLVAYVVPHSETIAQSDVFAETAHHIDDWMMVWDQVYAKSPHGPDRTPINTGGWKNSYDGMPIPEPEMVEWAEATKSTILSMKPRRILEIGCGTGVLVSLLAPTCEFYLALDSSREGVDSLQQWVCDSDIRNVAIEQRQADQLHGLAASSFDTVILNSVVQYFPSLQYFRAVLTQVIGLTAFGGRIFIGDVRNLDLLECFHVSREWFRSKRNVEQAEFAQRVREAVRSERELVIAPALFESLPATTPRITHVEIQLKRGRYVNELSKFRYDVIIELDVKRSTHVPERVDWGSEISMAAILRRLNSDEPMILEIERIPNARLRDELKVLGCVYGSPAADGEPAGEEPDTFTNLENQCGCRVTVGYSKYSPFEFRVDIAHHVAPPARPPLQEPERSLPLANDPLQRHRQVALLQALREFARSRLPQPMVPNAFVLLDTIPRTPNGKIDRTCLPPAGYAFDELLPQDVQLQTPTEIRVADIWYDLLKKRVGPHDNFFASGGHSLLAIQLLMRVQEVFGIRVEFKDLLENISVQKLSQRITGLTAQRGIHSERIPISPRNGLLPPSLLQENRLSHEFEAKLRSSAYMQSSVPLALELAGHLDLPCLKAALNTIVERHEVLRTAFIPSVSTGDSLVEGWNHIADLRKLREGGLEVRFVQRIRDKAPVDIRVEDLSHLQGDRLDEHIQRIMIDALEARFAYDSPPLLRTVLLRTHPTRFLFILVMSHLISDAWSLAVFQEELWDSYKALLDGRPCSLPILPFQYADFAAWQRRQLEDSWLKDFTAYYGPRLENLKPLVKIRTNMNGDMSAGAATVAFDRTFVDRLRSFAQAASTTVYVTLLTAFNILLHLRSGEERIGIWTFLSNREHSDTEHLIGWFATDHLLVCDLAPDLEVMDAIQRVRAVLIGATAHQRVSLSATLEHMKVDSVTPRLAYSNAGRITFELLHEIRPPSVPGLSIAQSPISRFHTQYSLRMIVREQTHAGGLTAVYARQLFTHSVICALLNDLLAITEQMIDAPHLKISGLSLPVHDGPAFYATHAQT